ncbi:pilus assembly protein [Thalassococcus profundi]|uniref:Pilus assembly protein n=1 Tax=Thalassococcus profundi TaxID=2282382 RepID=A0A369TM65_9RHOB|nr:TadE/TadG family type IV pilus assembly protein [Thalassococcus profundi]RDD66391.1 pilus assembly protein [Thalassococcus profundi]
MKSLSRFIRRITRDEEGSQTVEAVLWLPVFVMFLSLVIDVSMVFNRQSEFNRIVQDANRSYATGRLGSEDAAEAFIKTALGNFGASATVTTSLIDGIIFTRLTVPVTDLMPINSFPIFRDRDVVVANQQLAEF